MEYQISYWNVMIHQPSVLLGLQPFPQTLLEMLHRTVFPNFKLNSFVTFVLVLRFAFFLLELVIPNFRENTVLYPYMIDHKGQYYRLFTGFLRVDSVFTMFLQVCINMQLTSFFQNQVYQYFPVYWLGCLLGSGAFLILVDTIGDPMMVELGLVIGGFSAMFLVNWVSDVNQEAFARKANLIQLVLFNLIIIGISFILSPEKRNYFLGTYIYASLLALVVGFKSDSESSLNSFRKITKFFAGLFCLLLGVTFTSLVVHSHSSLP